jgi:hypothetical protein
MDWKTIKEKPPWDWPEGAAKVLLGVLLDERTPEPDRLLAVELAGNFTVMDDALANALLSTLRNGGYYAQIRSKAAISLGPLLEHAGSAGCDDIDDPPISEATYRAIRDSLHQLYRDASVPAEVRRRILETSVRAPQDWQRDAVRAAYACGDDAWRVTAVFCMGFLPGFDRSILEALGSGNEDIACEAIAAAGQRELDEAWPHVVALLSSARTEKRLLLAAIEAAVSIRPQEAVEALADLADSEDEEIAAAADEALEMADRLSGNDDEPAD